jgi:protein tyrosine phosphatase (PTP) superfamily phosphohydrolase (DUF442 family)
MPSSLIALRMFSSFPVRLFVFAVALPFLTACSVYTPRVTPRPSTWAKPLEDPALPNLHQVSPVLYRCARPGDDGYAAAKSLGVRTVVNLRPNFELDEDTALLETVHIPVETGDPSYEEAKQFFKVVDESSKTPVLLHCYHGADRTGAFTALYRINRQEWSVEEAIAEMTGGGFHFHTMWDALIPWVREAPSF